MNGVEALKAVYAACGIVVAGWLVLVIYSEARCY
jgi:hypothetical protein